MITQLLIAHTARPLSTRMRPIIRGETTKNAKTRRIPLNVTAQGVFLNSQVPTTKEGLVLKSRDGARFSNVDAACRATRVLNHG
jgi:hypothetical protein